MGSPSELARSRGGVLLIEDHPGEVGENPAELNGGGFGRHGVRRSFGVAGQGVLAAAPKLLITTGLTAESQLGDKCTEKRHLLG